MHKYLPRLIIMEHCHSPLPCGRGPSAADMHHMMMQHPSAAVVAAASMAGQTSNLTGERFQFYTYSFQETSFIAVTAYQNDAVRKNFFLIMELNYINISSGKIEQSRGILCKKLNDSTWNLKVYTEKIMQDFEEKCFIYKIFVVHFR